MNVSTSTCPEAQFVLFEANRDHAGDLALVLRRETADELSHFSVADQQDLHWKNVSCKRIIA